MIGPLVPAAPSWICATVTAMPAIVALPVTDLSALTVIEAVPDAVVVTGGISWLPLSTILSSWLDASMERLASPIATTFSAMRRRRAVVQGNENMAGSTFRLRVSASYAGPGADYLVLHKVLL